MRSRLETRWARVFDKLGIEYYYEPEIYTLGCIRYLPDFYLPQQNIYFEAKGVMTQTDAQKITALAEQTGRDIVVGYPNGTFQLIDMFPWEEYDAEGNKKELSRKAWWVSKGESVLAKCSKCHKWHFHNEVMTWDCRICGAWDKYWPEGFHQGSENLFEVHGI